MSKNEEMSIDTLSNPLPLCDIWWHCGDPPPLPRVSLIIEMAPKLH